MSDLDKKLEEALDLLCTREDDEGTSWGHDTVVDREGAKDIIKQAFIDAGWLSTGITKEAKQQINMMTGQEWYDKFSHEVGIITEKEAVSFHTHPSTLYSYMVDSAKKASGIE